MPGAAQPQPQGGGGKGIWDSITGAWDVMKAGMPYGPGADVFNPNQNPDYSKNNQNFNQNTNSVYDSKTRDQLLQSIKNGTSNLDMVSAFRSVGLGDVYGWSADQINTKIQSLTDDQLKTLLKAADPRGTYASRQHNIQKESKRWIRVI